MRSRANPAEWLLRGLYWLAGRRVYSLLVALALMVPFGIVGYMVFARLSFVDAVYQTMITITTVGYEDLATGAAGRLFNVVFLTLSVATFVVTASAIAAVLIEGRLREAIGRRNMEREIAELENHIILCGFGRFGQMTADELQRDAVRFLVLDADTSKIELAEERGVRAMHADATEESALQRAGLSRARGVISTLATDADNVYVALTVKSLRPELQVVTLAREGRAEDKLRAAGADYVVSPYSIGAVNMAQRMLRPHLSHFVEHLRKPGREDLKIQIEELAVEAGSPLVGQRLKETPLRREFGLTVVAVVKGGARDVHYNPEPETLLEPGDVLVCVGPPAGLQRALAVCVPPRG